MILARPVEHDVVENTLTGFQLLMKRWSSLHPYNVVDFLELPGAFQGSRLARAASDVAAEWGIARIELDAVRPVFRYMPANAPVRVQTLPTSGQIVTEQLLEHASHEMNTAFERDGRLPIRLFGMTAGKSQWLALTYEHWIADGYAAASLFLAIVRRYLGLPDSVLAINDRNVRRTSQVLASQLNLRFFMQHAVHSATRLIGLRSCYSPLCGDRENLGVSVHGVALGEDVLDRLKRTSRRLHVTINDLLMAALGQAVADATPERLSQRRRRRLALACVADHRRLSANLQVAMGVYLGHFHVLFPPRVPKSFEELARQIHQQTARAKQSKASLASLGEIAYCNAVWPYLNRLNQIRHFMNNHPIAAGVSNLRLPDAWFDDGLVDQLRSYVRAVPTGMMTPLAMGVTSIGRALAEPMAPGAGRRLTITLTARRAGFQPSQIQIIRNSLSDQLARL